MVDPYYLKYPTKPLPNNFTKNYTTATIGNAVMKFYVNSDLVTQRTAKELGLDKAMSDFESSEFNLGNLEKTKKNVANKKWTADLHIHIGEIKVLIETKEGRAMGGAYNMPYYNIITLDIPMNAKIISAETGELFNEETIITGRDDRGFSDLVVNREETNEFLKKNYATKDEAYKAAKLFLEKSADNIAFPILSQLFGMQQIKEDWNRLSTKYNMEVDRAGVMLVNFFKDDKNLDWAGYNQKADEIVKIIKSMESNYSKNKTIKKSDLDALNLIANFLHEKIKTETNEDVKTILEKNALICDIASGNFSEAISLRDQLVAKNKLNVKLSNIYSDLELQSKSKTEFEKNNKWSMTYREFYDKVME